MATDKMKHGKIVQIVVTPDTDDRREAIYALLDSGRILRTFKLGDDWTPWVLLPALPAVGDDVKVLEQDTDG